MKTNLFKMTLPAVALALAGLSSAYAVPVLTISDGIAGDSVNSVAQNGPAGTIWITSTPGVIVFDGTVGNWTLNVVDTQTQPAAGSPTSPFMDLHFNDTYTGAAGAAGSTLTISFAADGFGPLTGGDFATIGGTQFGTGSTGAVTFTTLLNGVTTLTTQTFGQVTSFSGEATSPLTLLGNTNILTETIVLTAGPSGYQVSGDANLNTVPDSGTTLVLLGSSLTVLGLFARSRKVVA